MGDFFNFYYSIQPLNIKHTIHPIRLIKQHANSTFLLAA